MSIIDQKSGGAGVRQIVGEPAVAGAICQARPTSRRISPAEAATGRDERGARVRRVREILVTCFIDAGPN
jgi:hypothetical protein